MSMGLLLGAGVLAGLAWSLVQLFRAAGALRLAHTAAAFASGLLIIGFLQGPAAAALAGAALLIAAGLAAAALEPGRARAFPIAQAAAGIAFLATLFLL